MLKQMQSSLRLLFFIALTITFLTIADEAAAVNEYQKTGTISGPTKKNGIVEYRISKQHITYAMYGDSNFSKLLEMHNYNRSVGFAFSCPGYYVIRGTGGLRLSVYISASDVSSSNRCRPTPPPTPPPTIKPPTITVDHPIPTAKPKTSSGGVTKPAPKLPPPPPATLPPPPPAPPKIIKSNVHYERSLVDQGLDKNATVDTGCQQHLYYKQQEAAYNAANAKLEAGITQKLDVRRPFDGDIDMKNSLGQFVTSDCENVWWWRDGITKEYIYLTPNKYGDIIFPFHSGTQHEHGYHKRTDPVMCPEGMVQQGDKCVTASTGGWEVPENWAEDPRHEMYQKIKECEGNCISSDDDEEPRQSIRTRTRTRTITRTITTRVAGATNDPRRVWNMCSV